MQLTDVEVRILGALVEKEATTPDTYPLSLNALVLACNQSSNRDPVMQLDEDAVKRAVNNLRQQSLVRAVDQAGARVMKFRHLMTETMRLEGAELAAMCVLMLRAAQTPGEIRGRSGRLHTFATVGDVDATLESLVRRQLVAQLPRRAGQKETRFAHLLSGAPVIPAEAPEAKPLSSEKHEFTKGLYGHITHTDLASADPAATKAWCASVLGWTFRPPLATPNGDLHLFAYSEKGGGAVRPTSGPELPGSIPYIHVEDAQAAYDKALAEGAEPMMAPTRVMEGVTVAIVRAPGGVPIGLSGP